MRPTPEQARAAAAPLQSGRRRVLRGLLWGTGTLLALGGGSFALLRRSPLDAVSKPGHLRHLRAPEYHLLNRARVVLLPTAGTGLTPVDAVPVMENLDRLFGLLPAGLRSDLGHALALFDNAAVVSGLHGKRFVDLDDAQAVAYFDAWSRGSPPQRAVQGAIKQLVYLSYWREPMTWPPIEYAGPVSDANSIPALGNAPLPDEDAP